MSSSIWIYGWLVFELREYEPADLSKLANIANTLALQGAKILGDSAALDVHQTGERLIEQGTDRLDGETASFGLDLVSLSTL